MSTYRFPLMGKIGIVRGLIGEVPSRLRSFCARREPVHPQQRTEALWEPKPLTEEEVRNLPVAHRYSA
jgi:hypothetical protein